MTSITRLARAAAESTDPRVFPRGRRNPNGVAALAWSRVGVAVAVAFVIAATLGVASSPAAAQQGDEQVRISARKVADGRVEFALQQRRADNSWGERLLPSKRFFPTTATVGRWLNSTPLAAAGDTTVRITARKVADGRIEFALQQRQADNSWAGRQLPSKRFFPTTATAGRWLNSTPVTPTTPSTTGGFSAVAVGDFHSCGLRTDGTITCWGSNQDSFETPRGQATPPVGRFSAVAAGAMHSCGVRVDGTVACWGSNEGHSHRNLLGVPIGQATPPAGQFRAVAAGHYHSCGLRTDGTVACWGINENEHDDAWFEEHGVDRYWEIAGVTTPPAGQFRAVAAGTYHSCGLRADATITCWGWDRDGYGTPTGQATPPAGQFSAVAAGDYHSCGLRTDGTIACWGSNDTGYYGETVGQATPPAGQFSAVAAGWAHSCGVRTDGTITCWGYNGSGQADAPSGRFSAVAAGSGHSCGLRTDGTIACWGRNDFGQATPPAG